MAILFHCMLHWGGEAKGYAQFDLPYFLFHPHGGHLISVDSGSYRTDQEEIDQMGRIFDQIVTSGEMTFPIPSKQIQAVFGLQNASQSRSTVEFAVGLIQYDEKSGRSTPLQVAFRLKDAKVKQIFPRKMKFVDPVTQTDSEELYYVASFKSPPAKNLRTMEAPA